MTATDGPPAGVCFMLRLDKIWIHGKQTGVSCKCKFTTTANYNDNMLA